MMMQKHTPTFPKNFHLPISQGVLQYKREKITRTVKHRTFHSYMKGRRKTPDFVNASPKNRPQIKGQCACGVP